MIFDRLMNRKNDKDNFFFFFEEIWRSGELFYIYKLIIQCIKNKKQRMIVILTMIFIFSSHDMKLKGLEASQKIR